MRVLLTGGAGFIGSHLARRFLERGWDVAVLDDFSSGSARNLPQHPRLEVHQGSVLHTEDVRRAARGARLVLHLASVVGMRLAFRERAHAYRVSVDGTSRVLAASGDLPFVLFSSSAVYGFGGIEPRDEAWPIDETELLACDGGEPGYAVGKWHAEQLALAQAKSRSVLVVRPYNVVGPRQTGRYGMVLPSFISRALAGEPLRVYDEGLQTRSFGAVETFCHAIWALLSAADAWLPGRNVVNIGSPTPTRIIDLARTVLRETNSTAGVQFVPYAEVFPGRRDVRDRVPDVRRLEQLVGERYWPTVAEIVRRVLFGAGAVPERAPLRATG